MRPAVTPKVVLDDLVGLHENRRARAVRQLQCVCVVAGVVGRLSKEEKKREYGTPGQGQQGGDCGGGGSWVKMEEVREGLRG